METAKDYQICDGLIDLSNPTGSKRVRDFQPPWRTVYVYRCPACGQERQVYANSYRGIRRTPASTASVKRARQTITATGTATTSHTATMTVGTR